MNPVRDNLEIIAKNLSRMKRIILIKPLRGGLYVPLEILISEV